MKRAFAAGLVLVLVGTAGCKTIMDKIKGGKGEGAEDAGTVATAEPSASATPPPAPEPLATNEADVKRFPDESKLPAPEEDDLDRAATARTEPNTTSKSVASLAKGDKVTLHAEKSGFFLVTFPDSKDPAKKLMGWVPQLSFVPAAIITGTKVTCPAGQGLFVTTPQKGPLSSKQIADLVNAGEALCAKACVEDKNCTAPMVCVKGGGTAVTAAGAVGKTPASICMKHHGGTTPPAAGDAGTAAHADAGGTPAASPDAGAPPATADAAAPPEARDAATASTPDAATRARTRAIPGLR